MRSYTPDSFQTKTKERLEDLEKFQNDNEGLKKDFQTFSETTTKSLKTLQQHQIAIGDKLDALETFRDTVEPFVTSTARELKSLDSGKLGVNDYRREKNKIDGILKDPGNHARGSECRRAYAPDSHLR